MLYWALVFLVIAVIAGLLGFGGVASTAAGIAQVLFFIFLVVFVIALVMGLMSRRYPPPILALSERFLSAGPNPPCRRGAEAPRWGGSVGREDAGELT